MRTPSATLYTLPHGIEVTGEYPARGKNRYWRLRIRPHPFFSGKVISDGLHVRRSRAVMSSIIGRALLPNEHVHHRNEDRSDDRPENLELLAAADHNRHHKTGSQHTEEAKQKISAGLKLAISEGRREPPPRQDWTGRKHSTKSKTKMSETKKIMIKEGRMAKPIPPIFRGESNSKTTISRDDVIAIRRRAASGEPCKRLAREYGICLSSTYNIINKATWSHV